MKSSSFTFEMKSGQFASATMPTTEGGARVAVVGTTLRHC